MKRDSNVVDEEEIVTWSSGCRRAWRLAHSFLAMSAPPRTSSMAIVVVAERDDGPAEWLPTGNISLGDGVETARFVQRADTFKIVVANIAWWIRSIRSDRRFIEMLRAEVDRADREGTVAIAVADKDATFHFGRAAFVNSKGGDG